MGRHYLQASIRVLVLFALIAGLTMLVKPKGVLASTCSQCVLDCSRQRLACLRQCESEGLFGCEEACNPFGTTCTQDCTDAGLCP